MAALLKYPELRILLTEASFLRKEIKDYLIKRNKPMTIYQLTVRFELASMTICFKKKLTLLSYVDTWEKAKDEGKPLTINGKNIGKVLQVHSEQLIKPPTLPLKHKYNVPVYMFF